MTTHIRLACATGLAVSLGCLAACATGRSSSIKDPGCCAAFQQSDRLPDQPPPGVLRLAIGGDSRNDSSQVVPWAFEESKKRGAKAFLFLGDLEYTRGKNKLFAPQLTHLGGVPFYPVIGNHEVEVLGFFRLPGAEEMVKTFKKDFLSLPGIDLAPFYDTVVYSVDFGDAVHFIALDNVSRRGEGFGPQQLAWLAVDLCAASAANKLILVGMHKPLAKNPVTTHAMDEDGKSAVSDSDAALTLFKNYKVAMVFVSHSHMHASFKQNGVDMRLTGGLGAPLVKGLAAADGGFHHFLLLDVPLGEPRPPLQVEVVRFPGLPTVDNNDEAMEAAAK